MAYIARVLCLVVVVVAEVRAEGPAAAWRRSLAGGGVYGVQSEVQLNSLERRDRELGYRIEADLLLQPAPDADAEGEGEEDDLLLRFQLQEARLMVLVRGAHRAPEWERRGSVWDAHGARPWYARLRRGAVRHVLLDPADPVDVVDYKKSLVSLFQIVGAGEGGREVDVSGECDVQYETLSDTTFRKIKRSCNSSEVEGVSAQRVARYSVEGVFAEEVLAMEGSLKVRSWHQLVRRHHAPAPAPASQHAHGLREHALTLHARPSEDEDAQVEVDEAIRLHRVALEGEAAGAGGTAQAAHAAHRLLPALRAASAPALLAALQAPRHRDVLAPLCRALGLSGTVAAVRAARDFLHLAARDPVEPLAHAFLAGFALASDAQEDAVLDVLKLGTEARHAAVGDSALLASAGAARSMAALSAVQHALLGAASRCPDAESRALRVLALGNARADATEALLEYAERDTARVAVAALRALRKLLLTAELRAAEMERIGGVVANTSAPLEVRAAALELVVMRRAASTAGAVPMQLLQLARALHAERSHAAHELRRVLWQRVETMRDAVPMRELLRLLPPELRTWDARAHGGTSSVLRRNTGWGAGAWRSWLDSSQVAARGLLRRGVVALLGAEGGEETSLDLEVEVWTRGLEAIAGGSDASAKGEAGAQAEPEGVAGGLGLSVGGVRMRDVMLFDGQAQLLGHIWAGTGSEPTAVLRALRSLREEHVALPLLCGGVLAVRVRGAVALALDAHAAVSLWHRTARGALELRTAVHAETSATLGTAWGSLHARRTLQMQPRLRIAFELDFYDGVSVCVRASSPDHHLERALELESVLGARRLRVRRGDTVRLPAPGRTFALGALNDVACRTLRASDTHEADD